MVRAWRPRRPVRSLCLSRFLKHLLSRCSWPLGAGEIGTPSPEARTDVHIELKTSRQLVPPRAACRECTVQSRKPRM